MKSTQVVSALVIASLGFSSVSFAQGWRDRGHDARDDRFEQRQERRAERFERRQERREWRHANRHYPAYPRHFSYRTSPYYVPPVAYPRAAPAYYYPGQVLPHEHRRQLHVVNDWHAHNLYAPPQGYHWARSDAGDFLLIAIATGLIANLLLGQ